MPAPRKSAPGPKPKSAAGPKSKASRPEVYPLGEHLAELLNPALAEPKTQGFGEAPQPKFETAFPESHPRGLTGAAVTADTLKALLEEGDPNIRNRPAWLPHRPPRPDKSEGGRAFRVVSEFEPKGDQPRAIEELLKGVYANERDQVLLGVTGSGKTFTMAKVIEATQRPALVLAPNKTLAAQLYGEFRNFFPDNAVEYFVSYYDYYQPEAYVPRTDTYIEKESDINEQIDRMRHCGDPRGAGARRRDHCRLCLMHLRHWLGRDLYGDDVLAQAGRKGRPAPVRSSRPRGAAIQARAGSATFRVACFACVATRWKSSRPITRTAPGGSVSSAMRSSRIVEFDPLTGHKTQDLEFVKIYANSHYVTPRPTLLQSIEGIKTRTEGAARPASCAEGRLLEAQRLEQRTLFDLEMLDATGSCAGIENYSRYLTGPPPGRAAADSVRVSARQCAGVRRTRAMSRSRRSAACIGATIGAKRRSAEYGFRLPSCMDNRPLQLRGMGGDAAADGAASPPRPATGSWTKRQACSSSR